MFMIGQIEKIITELKKRGWRPADFCREIGIRSQDWTNWKKRGVPAKKVAGVVNLFGWNYEWFVNDTGQQCKNHDNQSVNNIDRTEETGVTYEAINYEATDFAVMGLTEYEKKYPNTMSDPVFRKMAFKTLYKAWHNEEMRKQGAIPILELIA